MTTSVSVSLSIPPASLSPNSRASWQQVYRDKADYRHQARMELLHILPLDLFPWSGPVRVHVVWTVPNPRWLPDYDNAVARLQPAWNAGQDAGLYVDDRQITAITVERVVGRPKGVQLTFTREDG